MQQAAPVPGDDELRQHRVRAFVVRQLVVDHLEILRAPDQRPALGVPTDLRELVQEDDARALEADAEVLEVRVVGDV